ncbi:MAG: hypothetical protein J1E95_12315, partial [Muribaculaceae bacterium]|nr:hypothetical protein [Muribaculaceae bacterium]
LNSFAWWTDTTIPTCLWNPLSESLKLKVESLKLESNGAEASSLQKRKKGGREMERRLPASHS